MWRFCWVQSSFKTSRFRPASISAAGSVWPCITCQADSGHQRTGTRRCADQLLGHLYWLGCNFGARSLDELRVAGIALPLTWDVLFYTVLIAEFRADYCNGWWIPYRIVCTVLQDEASALLQPVVSLATAVLTDIGAAAGYASDTGVDLSPLQSALAVPGATTRGTSAFVTAQSCLTDAQSSMGASIVAADATLTSTSVATAGSAQAGVAALSAATEATGRLTSLVSADAYLRRTSINLANAST